ncbi:MAG: hypothetical protein CL398_12965 [Acidiferrobacteraceae bacterium]|nr:hypothetical protein [Acidiferrobacteraceae bacterium]
MAKNLPTASYLPTDRLNILVIKQTSLGDVLHSTAQVNAIKKLLPNCCLTLMTSTTAYDIYRHNPNVDKVILFDRYRVKEMWWRRPVWVVQHLIQTFQSVRQQKYELAIDFQGRWKTVIFLWGACASQKFVKGRWWFAHRFHQPKWHAIDEMNGLLKLAGLGPGGHETQLFASGKDRERVRSIISRHALENARWILCCPTSRWPTKDWPLNNYRQLANLLPEDVRIILSGLKSDRPAIDASIGGLPESRLINLAGELSIGEFAEFVSQAPVVVTMDSFSLHVAAAKQRPTVALFGPTDEKRVGPNNRSTIIVRAPQANCSRCYRRKSCPNKCVEKISPKQVSDAIEKILGSF